MPRPLRIQSPGWYHVTTRGNDGSPIYADDGDKNLFLALLNRVAGASRWDVELWCLMTTHFHFVIQTRDPNLSAGMHRLNGRYAQLFNERHRRTGHLFERRFSATPIEDEGQMENTVAYVLNNPVKAGLCPTAAEWPWSGGRLRDLALG
jgi:REP element-mobilizing transposase RayT